MKNFNMVLSASNWFLGNACDARGTSAATARKTALPGSRLSRTPVGSAVRPETPMNSSPSPLTRLSAAFAGATVIGDGITVMELRMSAWEILFARCVCPHSLHLVDIN